MAGNFQYDVIVVGAGPAGISAAIGLVNAGLAPLVLEAAAFPGAENWSGCVYFTEALAHPDLLGAEGLAGLAWERPLAERGLFATDGRTLLGASYRDPTAFANCYTVLRPVFDRSLTLEAQRRGATVLCQTTVLSLIRADGRVIGVSTSRGPFYAPLVFLAEGDAAHLVSMEGYHHAAPDAPRPRFLQGIKEVIPRPPLEIERAFGLPEGQGAAYEILLRNGIAARGKTARLNMGAFLYTNADTLSLGVVLPLDNLVEEFDGSHARLMEYVRALPVLRDWLGDAAPVAYGAKLIQTGGPRALRGWVDDGLAIGGAAAGLGVDFPFPNYTGPACASGLLLAQAVRAIRERGGSFSRDVLEEQYAAPLRASHYVRDTEFLRAWPEYAERSGYLFGAYVDLATGTARIWGRPDRSDDEKRRATAGMVAGALECEGGTAGVREDLRFLLRSLPVRLPGLGDLLAPAGRRPDTPGGGQLRFLLRGEGAEGARPPAFLARLAKRAAPGLRRAAFEVYRNAPVPLEQRLQAAMQAALGSLGWRDRLALAAQAGLLWLTARCESPAGGGAEAPGWQSERPATLDARLGTIRYLPAAESHIRVFWPEDLARPDEIRESPLWHLCPAGVYELAGVGTARPVIHAENCIKCESCWRATGGVDWGRTRPHGMVYDPPSAAKLRLWRQMEAAGAAPPRPPLTPLSWWDGTTPAVPDPGCAVSALARLEAAVAGLVAGIAAPPEVSDAGHIAGLHGQVGEVQAAARLLAERLDGDRGDDPAAALCREVLGLGGTMELHAASRRFFWVEAMARQLQQHHLPGLRRLLGAEPRAAEQRPPAAEAALTAWRERLEAVFDRHTLLALDEGEPLTPDARALLRELAREAAGAPPARRCGLLRELAAVDAGLAAAAWIVIRAADRLRESAQPGAAAWLARLKAGEQFPALVSSDGGPGPETWERVPLAVADCLLVEGPAGRLRLAALPAEGEGLTPLRTLGLSSSAPARIALAPMDDAGEAPADDVPGAAIPRQWAADFAALALGLADRLRARGIEQVESRVAFTAVFQDEEGRDTIAKFGSMKELLAEIDAHRAVLEELVAGLAGAEGVPPPWGGLAPELAKLAASAAIGTDCGTVAYNAYQFFGGMAYTAQDLIGKYSRDAAEFPFLLGEDREVARRLAEALLGSLSDPGALADEAWLPGAAGSPTLRPLVETYRGDLRAWAASLRDRPPEPGSPFRFAREAVGHWARRAALRRAAAALAAGEEAAPGVAIARLVLERTRAEPALGASAAGAAAALGASLLAIPEPEPGLPATEPLALDCPTDAPTRALYEEYLREPFSYESGDYLLRPAAVAALHVPEKTFADERLAARYRQLFPLFFERYVQQAWEGLPYPRFIEQLHRLPPDDLDFFIREGLFRATIPQEYGGGGWWKSEYSLLTYFSARFADMAQALTIQVNDTLGTVPILTALRGDLRRGRADLQAVLDAPPGSLSNERSPALRLLRAPSGSGSPGDPREGARELLAELGRRERTAERYLQLIAAGYLTIFGLTEPGAGSDTARIATGGPLRRAAIHRDADGTPYFLLDDDPAERRTVVDARHLVVEDGELRYRFGGEEAPVPLRNDDYDYETDDPARPRYYLREGRRTDFHDVAVIRADDAGEYVEYYEVSGSKMWITNARWARVVCLYARTAEGVSAFVFDREAEGFVVNRDEPKVGQRGSVTNPISLDRVRIPRENVLGLEGRGQVNALETLNHGRTGLGTLAVTMMEDVLDFTRVELQRTGRRDDPEVARRLGEMAAAVFGAETVAYGLAGLVDHPGTRSFRMESAISKYYATEVMQEVISASEALLGPACHVAPHPMEKMKRDARIMTIYEGTNQVQRYAIVKQLFEDLLPRWEGGLDEGPAEVAALRRGLRDRLREAHKRWGGEVVRNPNLQAVFFPLAEVAAHLFLLEALAVRTAWVRERMDWDDGTYRSRVEAATEVVRAQAWATIRERLDRYDRRAAELRENRYPAAVEVARQSLLQWERAPRRATTPRPDDRVARTLRVAVLAAPVPRPPAYPTLEGGELREPAWDFAPAERSCLARALALKAAAPEAVRLELIAAAPPAAEARLRLALASGFDQVTRLEAPAGPGDPGALVDALLGALRRRPHPDLVLMAPVAEASGRGILPTLVAAGLDCPLLAGIPDWFVDSGAEGTLLRPVGDAGGSGLPLPLVVTTPGDGPVETWDAAGYLRSTSQSVEPVDGGELFPQGHYAARAAVAASDARADGVVDPGSAAVLVRELLELAGGAVGSFAGPLATAPAPPGMSGDLVFVTPPAGEELAGSAANGARLVAALGRLLDRPARVILPVTRAADEATLRRLVAPLVAAGPDEVLVAVCPALAGASATGHGAALEALFAAGTPRWIFAGRWATEPLARLRVGPGPARFLAGASEVEVIEGRLSAAAKAFGGRLRFVQPEPSGPGTTCLILEDNARLGGSAVAPSTPAATKVTVLDLPLSYDAARDPLAALAAPADTSATWTNAECLIDLGYALRNRDNVERLIQPLEASLRRLGVRRVAVGGTRKATEELKLLPAERQIGQTGAAVEPRVLLALGVSGAPQHLDYVGEGTTILAFNRDPEAPIMTLNERKPLPRVYPVPGDLFRTLPEFLRALEDGES